MQRILLNLREARINKDKDEFGDIEPYFVFKIGKLVAKSSVMKGQGKNPKWNEVSVLPIFVIYSPCFTNTSWIPESLMNEYS